MIKYIKLAILFILIFFSAQTFQLALSGLELWYTSVVPALLPALFMITLISSDELTRKDIPLILTLCVASGCPGSAILLSSAYRKRLIDHDSFIFWLIALNNPGLPFLISLVFKGRLWHLLPVYISSFLCAYLYKMYQHAKDRSESRVKNLMPDACKDPQYVSAITLETAIENSMYVMLRILGYILIAYIASGLIYQAFPSKPVRILTSYIEITTGVVRIYGIWNRGYIFDPLLLSVVGFQGLSSIRQVYAVTKDDGIRLPFLLKYKMLNAFTAFSIGLLIDIIYKYFTVK